MSYHHLTKIIEREHRCHQRDLWFGVLVMFALLMMFAFLFEGAIT